MSVVPMAMCMGLCGPVVNTASCSPQCSSASGSSERRGHGGGSAWSSSERAGRTIFGAALAMPEGRAWARALCDSERSFHGRAGLGASRTKTMERFRVFCEGGGAAAASAGGDALSVEWTRKLPAKRKALYSHSLPCIEAWLQSLGFHQSKDDRAMWNIERSDWHALLSLDVTDLYVRYLKSGPGNLERDIERKFSYALSREDLENAILGGP